MKHFPKALISFRKLLGGQFGTLDVAATDRDYVQLALGGDFVQVTRPQWIALRSSIDRFFACETEKAVFTREDGDPVIFEDEVEVVEEEAVRRPPPPAKQPQRSRSSANRQRSANG